MNKIRSLLRKPQLVFISIVFSAMLFLTFVIQDTLRETVLVAILYLLWLGKLAFQSFDQRCIWSIGLILTLVMTTIFVIRKIRIPVAKSQPAERHPSIVPRRIRFWRTEMWVGSSAAFVNKSRPSDLRRLILKTLAYRENLDTKEIRNRLRSQQLQVPREVGYVLGMDTFEGRVEHQPRFVYRFVQKFNSLRGVTSDPTHIPDPRFEKVASYLESILENDHGIRNR